MLPYGYEKQRNNVLSPSTLSLETSLIVVISWRKTDFTAPKKLLHFAPEQAFLQTISQSKLRLHHYRFVFALADVKADICNLPFEEINTM
jgi:hypothetical protein